MDVTISVSGAMEKQEWFADPNVVSQVRLNQTTAEYNADNQCFA